MAFPENPFIRQLKSFKELFELAPEVHHLQEPVSRDQLIRAVLSTCAMQANQIKLTTAMLSRDQAEIKDALATFSDQVSEMMDLIGELSKGVTGSVESGE